MLRRYAARRQLAIRTGAAALEAELLGRRRFASPAEAKTACSSSIEGFRNPGRLHSALGCTPPVTFEQENTPEIATHT